MKRHWPVVRLTLVVLVLVLTAWNGLVDGLSAAKLATTPGVRVAAILQLLCGVSAGGALFSMVMDPPRVFSILVFWGIAFAATAAIAPVVAGGAPLSAGVAPALVSGAAAALVVWGWRVHFASERASVS